MKMFLIALMIFAFAISMFGCDFEYTETGTRVDTKNTIKVASALQENQPTPTDIDYSLERYNLIRRAYWVNGQREKARSIPCPIADVPLGYAVLLTDNGSVFGRFIVEGKVSSLNSYLTPDSEFYEKNTAYRSANTSDSYFVDDYSNKWLADVDGSYGYNSEGIFFFTPSGNYIEWTGTYFYSDIPVEIEDPVVKYEIIEENVEE